MAAARTRDPAPPIQLKHLERRLSSEGVPRGTLLRGEERYFVDRAIELLVRAALDAGQEVCRHDAGDPEFSAGALLDDLGAAPLFASSRCVVVRGADPLLKKQGKDHSPFTRSALAFLQSDREGTLVVAGQSIRVDHALAKAIDSGGGPTLSCRKLWDTPPSWDPDPRKVELALWARTRGGELGVKLSPEDGAYLAAAVGGDLAALDTQLEKLRRAGGKVRLAEVVGWESGGNPWKCADALLSGNPGRGLAAVEALFRVGFHSDRDGRTEVAPEALNALLLGALRSKARQGLIGSRSLARGASLAEAAERAGVPGRKLAQDEFARTVQERDVAAWQRVWRAVGELERRNRLTATLDANDYARLALTLALRRGEPARASRGGRR